MDDAETEQQLGDDEEREERREQHLPPDGKSPYGSGQRFGRKTDHQQHEQRG
ncbi:hypothetical protein D3C84_1115140 [compost metagenome]